MLKSDFLRFVLVYIGVAAGLFLLCLIISFICFYKVFYSPKRKPLGEDEYELPPGKIYLPFKDEMYKWMKAVREMPHTDFEIKSFDGLTLRGRYYEYSSDAPVEIMFHGYQGNSERDLCGGVFRAFELGHNALLVDQRAAGRSDGSIITFGINEHKDCLSWVDFAISHFGADVKIVLTGVSMGAATVVMAAGKKLPENVMYVLADCGYFSAKEIIKKVISEMHLPAAVLYPFVKLGARIFGKFDLEEYSPVEAVKNAEIPVIFIHGDADDFVPYEMSYKLWEVCSSKKKLVTIKGAGHGLAYPVDKSGYINALLNFKKEL